MSEWIRLAPLGLANPQYSRGPYPRKEFYRVLPLKGAQ
jgi:hypothetical protein